MSTQFKICSCNKTMPLDKAAGASIGQMLGIEELAVSDTLCRRDVSTYLDAIKGVDDIVVACTQERALFSELAQQSVAPIRFVNIREYAGWGSEAKKSLPKVAALLAAAALPDPDPVSTVQYKSNGNLLIIGSAEQALPWARRMAAQMDVNVLLTQSTGNDERLNERNFPVFSGNNINVEGWLGAFKVRWQQSNPIDLEACTRCNACVEVCPENAIDFSFQIDLDKCGSHRDCLKACGIVGAIDFDRLSKSRESNFDLILDLSTQPVLRMHQLPQGYFAPGANVGAQFSASLQIMQMVGEFEKPKFFAYKDKLCAHSRSGKEGCNACIDVCSASAISGAGDKIQVNPNLCMGCGACATVCPTGAMSYSYMRAPDLGLRLKTTLNTYIKAGGQSGVILLHSKEAGAQLLQKLGQNTKMGGRGLPANVIPVEVHHTASTGIDLWLTSIAYGAKSIAILTTDEEAPEYHVALQQQINIAQEILNGFGYAGQHLHLLNVAKPQQLEAVLYALSTDKAVQLPRGRATFNVAQDKRVTLDFALDHLQKYAPLQPEQIILPPGSPFGAIAINKEACTLCMSCVGACPSSALMDNANAPQIRFVERNCVQCGLCEKTCPENAIQLIPRLLLSESARQPAILNEAKPYHCVSCHKPFATAQMIETMLLKLSSHSAFSSNIDRIKMCSDCRVVDMMKTSELSRPH